MTDHIIVLILQGWNAFNVLHRSAGLVGALDVGYTDSLQEVLDSKPKLLFLLGADGGQITRDQLPSDCFVVSQGKCSRRRAYSI